MDNKRLIIILSVWTVIFTIIGGTLAYWNWQSADNRKTNITFTVNRDYTCGADSGGNITSSDVRLAPAKCTDPVYAIKRPITTSVTTTGDKVVSMDLWLNINNISTNLTNTPNFKWAITKNGNTCSGVIKQGDFRNIQDNKIDLLDGVEYATLDDTYYLYIWLDETENNANTMNQSFDFSISGKCEDNGLEKAILKDLNTTNYFREADYKTKITDIAFIYDKDLPSGITTNNEKIYDLGTSASKPITGYLIENTDLGAAEDTYKLYVSSKYKIYTQNLGSAFNGMTVLKNVSFDNFDTSLTTNMAYMFYGCSSLINLDLSTFNVSNVTGGNGLGMYRMFSMSSNLQTIDFSNWNTSKTTNMIEMFDGCNELISIDVSSFDTSNITSMQQMFQGCSSLTSLDVSHFNTSKVGSMYMMFNGCNSLVNLDVTHFDTSNVTNMQSMFKGCGSLTSLDVSSFNTSRVTVMTDMFNGCSSLTSLDVSSFNTSNVTEMSMMFSGCNSLTNLDVSHFDTSNVTSMRSMFINCSKLPSLNVSHFDTSNVINMGTMFQGCSSLTSLDLSSWNVSNVTTTGQAQGMYRIFWGCSNLSTIYVSDSWNTDNVTLTEGMFGGCTNLVGGSGTKYNSSYQDKTYARIDNPPDSPGYLTYKAYNGN